MAVDAEVVVDAAAALAFLKRERGWENVPAYLGRGIMSVINFAETVQRLHRSGYDPEPYVRLLDSSGMKLIDADRKTAAIAGDLERVTKPFGLSLADRFCLSLALQRKVPVVTADKPFASTGLGIQVILLR